MRSSDDDDFDEIDFRRRLGQHIQRVRKQCGYSQNRLTDEAGMRRGTLSKIENAQSSPQVTTLARIAKTLGIPLKKLTDIDV